MEIHETTEELYRSGYRAIGGRPHEGHRLQDPDGKTVELVIDHRKLRGPLYSKDPKETILKIGKRVQGFARPLVFITDQLLLQMQAFGNTTDGFLCDLATKSEASNKVVELLRKTIAEGHEYYCNAIMTEQSHLIDALLVTTFLAFCYVTMRISNEEVNQCGKDLSVLVRERFGK